MARRAAEAIGWIELGCPEHALKKIEALLSKPGARPFGLKLKVSACIDLHRYADALGALDELRPFEDDLAWLDLTEAWCRKRTEDLPAAVRCMERLVSRNKNSAIGHFNLGCYLAMCGEHDRAVDEVTIACGIDAQFRDLLETERDLESVRDDPRFRSLLRG